MIRRIPPKDVLAAGSHQPKLADDEPDAKAILPEPRSVKKANSYHIVVKQTLHDMKRLAVGLILFAALAAASRGLHAQSDLHDALKDSVGAHWIYDDFAQAKARAKQTGQPLLVLFRCVP
jgi:hypothetical protein